MNMQHGVVPLLKPPGMTSHDAVAHVRRVLKNKRVGHTGTLDPAAAGVLPICVGQATRLVEALQGGTKEYLAEATFGFETDTLDAVGQIVRECGAAFLTEANIAEACRSFQGAIQQVPPLHSAIKVDGRRLYDIARAGGGIEVASREVNISVIEVTRFFGGPRPRAFIRVECSGGTYIRSLVRDIGLALGNAATMTFLSRLRNSSFELAEAVTPEEFERAPRLISLPDILVNLYGAIRIDNEASHALWQGKQIASSGENQSPSLWSNRDATVFALATNVGSDLWKPEKVFDLRN